MTAPVHVFTPTLTQVAPQSAPGLVTAEGPQVEVQFAASIRNPKPTRSNTDARHRALDEDSLGASE